MTAFVYVIGAPDGCVMKIGFSANPKQRLCDLRKQRSRLGLELLLARQCENARGIEGLAHRLLRHRKLRGEWFLASPREAAEAVRTAFFLLSMPLGIEGERRAIAEAAIEQRYEQAALAVEGCHVHR